MNGEPIYQRKHDDCGAAALATLLGVSYETVEKAWLECLGRETDASRYWCLIHVARHLGVNLERTTVKASRGGRRIVRVRPERGSSQSHWVVMFALGSIWCPYSGFHYSLDGYEQPFAGRALWIRK